MSRPRRSGRPPPVGPPPSGPPPPVGPPLPGSPPSSTPPAGPAPSSAGRRSWRFWLVLALLAVLLLGGCGVLVTVGGLRAFESLSAPIDVANIYLDAARTGGDLTDSACRPDDPPHPATASSLAQNLTSVDITNRLAEVNGSITLEDGITTTVRIHLAQRDGEWCVREVVH